MNAAPIQQGAKLDRLRNTYMSARCSKIAEAVIIAAWRAFRPGVGRLGGGSGRRCGRRREHTVSGYVLLPLLDHVERDIDDHILLATDHLAAADFG